VFENLTKAKKNAEKNLQNSKELFESHLNNVFANPGNGWEETVLGKVCNLQNGFAFKSKDYVKSSNTLNFRMSQIRPGGGIDLNHNNRYLPDSYSDKYKEFLLKDGDIVIAMTDMALKTKILGVPTIVETDGRKLLLNQRVGKLFDIDLNRVYIPFLRLILISPQINQYYKSLGRGGLQINIGKQDILNANIKLPSILKQKEIVKQLDALSAETKKLEKIYEQKLADLEELKKSVLSKAFTGQL
jgi:type I restriction enzyme S subunit